MTDQAKLTETQTTILKAASRRPDSSIDPLPPTLRGGVRTKVIAGLIARGLVTDADCGHQITDAGYAAIGKRRPTPKTCQKGGIAVTHAKRGTTPAIKGAGGTTGTVRPGTKLAAIVDAMRKPGGATVAQMMAGTGWQAHTVRGAISGMVRKRLGYEVVIDRAADGQRTYRIG